MAFQTKSPYVIAPTGDPDEHPQGLTSFSISPAAANNANDICKLLVRACSCRSVLRSSARSLSCTTLPPPSQHLGLKEDKQGTKEAVAAPTHTKVACTEPGHATRHARHPRRNPGNAHAIAHACMHAFFSPCSSSNRSLSHT